MAFIGIRELSRQVSKVLARLQDDGEPVIITNQGRPVAALVAVDQEGLEDLVLAATPEAARRRARADEDVAAGGAVRLADAFPDDEEASDASLYEQLRPAHAAALGWEPPDEIIEVAVSCVSEVTGSVLAVIAPEDEHADEVGRRVEQLNADLYRRLWTHRLRTTLDDRVAHGTVASGSHVSPADVESAVQSAAEQLRVINEPLVAAGAFSVGAYAAFLTSLANFDDMAHDDEHAEVAHAGAEATA